MKRLNLHVAAFCLLLGCSMGGETGGETGGPIGEQGPVPELLYVRIVSGTEIGFEFSAPVKRVRMSFEPSLEVARIEEEGSTVRVRLERGLEPGKRVLAEILAEDAWGTGFSRSVPFQAGEPAAPVAVPALVINELRTESSASRSEFVEFRMLTAGNLDGVRVFVYRSGGGRTPTLFEFPPTIVAAGDYVVLHLRTLEGANQDMSPSAHNFRIPGSSSRLNKTGAIYVLDRDYGVLGAVMLSESPDPSAWEGGGRAHFAEIAGFLFEHGAWKSSSGGVATPADAVITSAVGTAATRSVSRDESVANTNTAADWYVTANNGATPGMPNDPRRLGS